MQARHFQKDIRASRRLTMARITIRPARKWWASPLAYTAIFTAVALRPLIGERRADRFVCLALGFCSKYGVK